MSLPRYAIKYNISHTPAFSLVKIPLSGHLFSQRSVYYTFHTINNGRVKSILTKGCLNTTIIPLPEQYGDVLAPYGARRYMGITNDQEPPSLIHKRSVHEALSAYYRLMRFHALTPVLIFCYPAMWSTFMALPSALGLEEVKKIGLFCLGAFFGRTAGCCVNDMADRHIDKHVERTKTRPLAAGLVSTREALMLTSINASLGLAVLLQFDLNTIRLGILTAFGACCYPFMKRFTNYPQLFLGLASNISVFLTWSAIAQSFTMSPVYLYLASSLWTVIYDTVYAHQDKKFDKLIGVKSLALHWGENTKKYCKATALGISLLLAAAGYNADLNEYFYALLALSHLWMNRQIKVVDLNDSKSCLLFFKRSVLYGALVLGAIITGKDVSLKL